MKFAPFIHRESTAAYRSLNILNSHHVCIYVTIVMCVFCYHGDLCVCIVTCMYCVTIVMYVHTCVHSVTIKLYAVATVHMDVT